MSQSHCNSKADKRIACKAPDRATIRRYAGDVSARMATKHGDQTETKFTRAFSEFLGVVVNIQARHESEAAHG